MEHKKIIFGFWESGRKLSLKYWTISLDFPQSRIPQELKWVTKIWWGVKTSFHSKLRPLLQLKLGLHYIPLGCTGLSSEMRPLGDVHHIYPTAFDTDILLSKDVQQYQILKWEYLKVSRKLLVDLQTCNRSTIHSDIGAIYLKSVKKFLPSILLK